MKKTIQVANICLMDDKNNILLLRRSENLNNAGFWGFPGGMIDDDEEAKAAATRELKEETGISQGDIEIITFNKFLITKPTGNVEITSYLAKIINEVEINLDAYEHTDYKWVDINNILETKDLVPGVSTILKKLFELDS